MINNSLFSCFFRLFKSTIVCKKMAPKSFQLFCSWATNFTLSRKSLLFRNTWQKNCLPQRIQYQRSLPASQYRPQNKTSQYNHNNRIHQKDFLCKCWTNIELPVQIVFLLDQHLIWQIKGPLRPHIKM